MKGYKKKKNIPLEVKVNVTHNSGIQVKSYTVRTQAEQTIFYRCRIMCDPSTQDNNNLTQFQQDCVR